MTTINVKKQLPYKILSIGVFYLVDFKEKIDSGTFILNKSNFSPCREMALQYFNKNPKANSLFFEFPLEHDIQKINKFIKFFENKCKIPTKHRVTIFPTNEKTIIGISFGKFWSANILRKDLLTALLRTSLLPYKSNQKRLNNSEYLSGSNSLDIALKMFVSGYNKLKSPHNRKYEGWLNSFYLIDIGFEGNILIKRKKCSCHISRILKK